MFSLTIMTLAGGVLYGGLKLFESINERYQSRQESDQSSTANRSEAHIEPIDDAPEDNAPTNFEQAAEPPTPSNEGATQADRKRQIERLLGISSSAMGLFVAGAIYPPLALLSAIPGLYVTGPIWKDAYDALTKEHKVRAAVLDATLIGITVATGSFGALALGGFLHMLNRRLLVETEDSARNELLRIFDRRGIDVWIEVNGVEVNVPLERVRVGDMVIVRAGQVIPIDGVIAIGAAGIDQRTLTGESQPVEKYAGDRVFACSVVLSGSIRVCVEQTGEDTIVAKIADIFQQTSDFKSTIQTRGERVADMAAAPFLALGAIALPLLGPLGAGSVLTASIGYQLRTLGPIGMLNFLTVASRSGILIKDGRSLEILQQIDTVIFDKTGTLTMDRLHVVDIHIYNGRSENDVLQLAAIAEHHQSHPIARAILQEAKDRQLEVVPSDDARYEIGYGIRLQWRGRSILVGSARFVESEGIVLPASALRRQFEVHELGRSLVHVTDDRQLIGSIELCATVRPEAHAVIQALQQRGLSTIIISGDHEGPTRELARSLGVDHYYSEALPEDKAKHIAALQNQGKKICFVGDGINDAIALKQANTSVSLRGAATVATDAAQVVLMGQSLQQLPKLFEIAENFDKNMKLGFAMTIIPGIIGVYGAFFLHFGLVAPMLLNYAGMAIGIGNAVIPRTRASTSSTTQPENG